MPQASRAQVRPPIDLDLGHRHQFGYRHHQHIPSKRGEKWRIGGTPTQQQPAERSQRP